MLHYKSCSSETGLPPNRNKCRLVVVSAATAVFVRSSRSEQQVRHQQLITVAAGEELVIKQKLEIWKWQQTGVMLKCSYLSYQELCVVVVAKECRSYSSCVPLPIPSPPGVWTPVVQDH